MAKTNHYIIVSRTDPDYATIITDCTTKHQAEAPGHNLSVVQLSNGTDMIKIKNGDSTWRSEQTWNASIQTSLDNSDLHDTIRLLIDSAYSSAATQVPNCEFWIDAGLSEFVEHTDNAISQLTDKSGNARHAVQATEANKPIWDSGTGSATFDGTNSIMVAGTAAAFKFLHATAHTVFVVFEITDEDPQSAQDLISTYNTVGIGYDLKHYDVPASQESAICYIGKTGTNIVALYESNDSFPTQQRNLIVTAWEYGITGDDFQFHIGAALGSSVDTSSAPSSSNPDHALNIGGTAGAASFKGKLYECTVYSRKLNEDEIAKIAGPLKTKWSYL